jgi:hypothetical protein
MITATNLGPLDPPGFAPTGRRLEVQGVDMLDFRDGQVSSIRTYFDVLRAAEQLLEMRLRPYPHSFRERLFVFLQRLRARRIRRLHQ